MAHFWAKENTVLSLSACMYVLIPQHTRTRTHISQIKIHVHVHKSDYKIYGHVMYIMCIYTYIHITYIWTINIYKSLYICTIIYVYTNCIGSRRKIKSKNTKNRECVRARARGWQRGSSSKNSQASCYGDAQSRLQTPPTIKHSLGLKLNTHAWFTI